MNRGRSALLAVVAAVAALVGAGTATPPAPVPASGASGQPATVPVAGATAVCPSLRNGPGRSSAVSAALALALAPGAGPGATGQVTSTLVPETGADADPAPTEALALERPGQALRDLLGDVPDAAAVLRATGPLAGGLDAEQRDRAARGPARGLAGVRCGPPVAESWFVGGSQGAGQRSYLLLVNPEDQAAVVDVRLWSAEGPVDPRPGAGLVVEPRSRRTIPVDRLAPGRTALAGQVSAARGRVFSALLETAVDGDVLRGVEYAVASPPPAPAVSVAGLPQGPGRRRVLVTNPGEEDTVVRLRLSTGEGQFVPTGEEAVAVPAGTTVVRDVTEEAAGSPVSVEVLSEDGSVLAAGQAVDTQRGRPSADLSYSAPGLPLAGPALLADVPVSADEQPVLLLAAPGQDARVVLTPVPLAGREVPEARTVEVAGGSARAVRLEQVLGRGGPYALQVEPAGGSGPVLAALHVREQASDGPRTTTRGLQAALPAVPRPVVQGDDPAVAGAG